MAELKYYVDVDLQNNLLNNTTVGSNSTMSASGQFQYNTSNNRLEYHNGSAVKLVANLDDVAGLLDFKGAYDASTDTPHLDSAPFATINKGDFYVVTVAGTFFTEAVKVGDSLIAQSDSPTTLAGWVVLQANVDIATTTTPGLVELATTAEITAGTAGALAVTAAEAKTALDLKVNKAGDTMSGILNMGSNKITNVTDPTSAQDAATKAYVDSQTSGIYFSNDYLAAAWSSNTLTVTHNLNTLSPKVFSYESGNMVLFSVSVTSANVITLTKNAGVSAPTTLKVGVSK